MKAWPVEGGAKACESHAQEVIDADELSGELERQITNQLANIFLHQYHHSPSHQEVVVS
jgi:hypothetical protein